MSFKSKYLRKGKQSKGKSRNISRDRKKTGKKKRKSISRNSRSRSGRIKSINTKKKKKTQKRRSISTGPIPRRMRGKVWNRGESWKRHKMQVDDYERKLNKEFDKLNIKGNKKIRESERKKLRNSKLSEEERLAEDFKAFEKEIDGCLKKEKVKDPLSLVKNEMKKKREREINERKEKREREMNERKEKERKKLAKILENRSRKRDEKFEKQINRHKFTTPTRFEELADGMNQSLIELRRGISLQQDNINEMKKNHKKMEMKVMKEDEQVEDEEIMIIPPIENVLSPSREEEHGLIRRRFDRKNEEFQVEKGLNKKKSLKSASKKKKKENPPRNIVKPLSGIEKSTPTPVTTRKKVRKGRGKGKSKVADSLSVSKGFGGGSSITSEKRIQMVKTGKRVFRGNNAHDDTRERIFNIEKTKEIKLSKEIEVVDCDRSGGDKERVKSKLQLELRRISEKPSKKSEAPSSHDLKKKEKKRAELKVKREGQVEGLLHKGPGSKPLRSKPVKVYQNPKHQPTTTKTTKTTTTTYKPKPKKMKKMKRKKTFEDYFDMKPPPENFKYYFPRKVENEEREKEQEEEQEEETEEQKKHEKVVEMKRRKLKILQDLMVLRKRSKLVKNVDVVFLCDISGCRNLSFFKKAISILEFLKKKMTGFSVRVGFVGVRYKKVVNFPLVKELENVLLAVNQFNSSGGSNQTSDVIGGIESVCGMNWDGQKYPTRIVFHITDKPSFGTSFHNLFIEDESEMIMNDQELNIFWEKKMKKVLGILREKRVQYYFYLVPSPGGKVVTKKMIKKFKEVYDDNNNKSVSTKKEGGKVKLLVCEEKENMSFNKLFPQCVRLAMKCERDHCVSKMKK